MGMGFGKKMNLQNPYNKVHLCRWNLGLQRKKNSLALYLISTITEITQVTNLALWKLDGSCFEGGGDQSHDGGSCVDGVVIFEGCER